MGLTDPTTSADPGSTELQSLTPRIDSSDVIGERMTPDVIDEIERELTRPLEQKERGIAASN